MTSPDLDMMDDSNGALPSDRATQASPQAPSGLDHSVSIPSAEDLLRMAARMTHPTAGVLRGIYGSDAPDKIIGMKVRELRHIAEFVSLVADYLEAQSQ